MERIKLTKSALSRFIRWSATRYNDWLGYGTKKEAVETAFASIKNGFYTQMCLAKTGEIYERCSDKNKTSFLIQCAGAVGENYNSSRGPRYWRTRQPGGTYQIDCKDRYIKNISTGEVIQFKEITN